MIDDQRLSAIVRAAEENARAHPDARRVDAEHAPRAWTPEQERELVERLHGSDAERLDALIAEYNEGQRSR